MVNKSSRPRVAAYLRVSRSDQSFNSQEDNLRDYARRRGWVHLGFYREKIGGAKTTRPELQRLMQDCREGLVDIVLVYKFDRWGRSTLHGLALIQELATRKIGFVTATEIIDTTTDNPMAQFQIDILAAVASFDRVRIIERVNAGLAAARRRGRYGGRPRKNDELLRLAFHLRDSTDLSTTEIARKTKLSRQLLSLYFTGKRKLPE